MSRYQSPREDWPDLRDLLTDDGQPLPRTILTREQQADVDAAMRSADRLLTEHTDCTCRHELADHREHTQTFYRGQIPVTYTQSMPCTACECADYEETPDE